MRAAIARLALRAQDRHRARARTGAGVALGSSPAALRAGGTTVWRHEATSRCRAADSVYSMDRDQFEPVLEIENRHDRLVVICASTFHLSASGWGSRLQNARLFQTLFWKHNSPKPRRFPRRIGTRMRKVGRGFDPFVPDRVQE